MTIPMLAGALLLCGSLAGQDVFLQMSDTQFGMYAKDAEFSQETANFEFAVASANRLKPRFAIVCGDLVNKAGDSAQIAEYLRISAKLDKGVRLYHVAGNHDVGNEPTPESLAAWRDKFGRDYYSFREGAVYGIVLNSSLIHSPGKAQAEYEKQDDWLRAELMKARASGAPHVVVFQHHPWFLERGDEADQYFNIPLVRRRPLIELFRDAGVRWLFSGHYHRNAVGRDGEIEAVTTGPVGMPLGGARSGFRIVRVDGAALRHEFVEFGALPNQLK
ncbi:MAG: metallophosphoesterase [Bryobacteraceae bacterium]|nr:metallophosphoesterase [Bryobacteraceae bacterium]